MATETTKKDRPTATPAPDVSGTAEEKAPELSVTDLLKAELAEESIRVFDHGKEAKDPVSVLMALADEAIKAAKGARAAYVSFTNKTGLLAEALVEMRKAVVLPSGLPDWSGSSKAYKRAAGLVIDAAQGPDESRATVANRLQRRVARKLPESIAFHVNDVEKIKLDEDEVRRIVGLGPKAMEGDEKNNEKVQALVQHVNEHFRVGSHADNEPSSPFEARNGAGGSASAGGEGAGVQAKRDLPQFRANMSKLTMDLVSLEVVHISQEAWKIITSDKPAFGEGGRQTVAGNFFHAASILYAAGKILDDRQLTKDEREAMEKAIAIA